MRKNSEGIKHQIAFIFVLLFIVGTLNGQVGSIENKNALDTNIKKLYDSYFSMDISNLYDCKAVFERLLSSIENENRYLAHYYIALSGYYISGLIFNDKIKKEKVIDDAINNISKCLQYKPKYVEAMILQASLYGVKINLSPIRGMDLGIKYQKLISEAKSISPNNPRIYLVSGISNYFSPPQYGGGLDKARIDFDKAIECYKKQSLPVSSLEPTWGEEECYYWLGEVSLREGYVMKAKEYYEKSLKVNPHYSRISDHLLPALLKMMNSGPEIVPGGGEFLINDSILVRLSHRFDNNYKIKYCINENTPGEKKWFTYTNGFYIKNTCVILAMVEYSHNMYSLETIVNFKACTRNNFNPALNTNKQLKSGIIYKLYEGEWNKLPDFKNEKKLKTDVVNEIAIPKNSLEDCFGLIFSGFIDIPESDIYIFYLESDDGSKLFIDNQMIIDNDGLHGPIEKSYSIGLSKGIHSIELHYFQNRFGKSLKISLESSNIKKSSLKRNVLFH